MSAHTPGPLFAVREDEYRTCIRTMDGRVIGMAYGRWEDSPVEHAEIEGNARLWTAAEELLAALRHEVEVRGCMRCRPRCDPGVAGLPDSRWDERLHDPGCPSARARAAIAKAVGP